MAAYAKRGSSGRLMSQINVVPYIDVMLVLLVIFMVTAPLISTSVVELPQISKSSAPPAQPMEVTVKADGSLLLRDKDKSTSERSVTLDQLLAVVKEKQARNPEQPVVIAADQNIAYGKVLEVMDALQRNRVKKVGLLVRPKGGNG